LAALDTRSSHAIVVVAFIVTVSTLLLQGLTLPLMIKRLKIAGDVDHAEDVKAMAAVRKRSREAGKAYLMARREEWADKYDESQLKAFDEFAKRMTRV